MTIVQLEYLLAVANSGSFSAAAEKCFVTQPSLSMQVKNLEAELGVILFDRSKKPVIPTEIGTAVLEQAHEALKNFQLVKERVNDLKGEIAGTLRLGVIPTVAPYLLHRFVPGFLNDYPKVDLQVCEMLTGDLIPALNHDMIDVAILAGGTSPDEIAEEELFDDRFYAYVAPAHPFYERSNVRIEDINMRRLLLLSKGHCLRDQVMELCLAQKKAGAQSPFEGGSLETLMRMVDNTAGMTVIPEMVIDFIPEARKGQVKTLAKGAASRKITLAVRRTYVKRSLVDALKASILAVPRVRVL